MVDPGVEKIAIDIEIPSYLFSEFVFEM